MTGAEFWGAAALFALGAVAGYLFHDWWEWHR